MKNLDCAVAMNVEKVVDLAGNLSKALRQLRRELRGCKDCVAGDGCVLRSNFQSQVTAAITQVQEERNLIPARLNYE